MLAPFLWPCQRQDMNPLIPGVTTSAVKNRFRPLVKEKNSRGFTTTGPANAAIFPEA